MLSLIARLCEAGFNTHTSLDQFRSLCKDNGLELIEQDVKHSFLMTARGVDYVVMNPRHAPRELRRLRKLLAGAALDNEPAEGLSSNPLVPLPADQGHDFRSSNKRHR